MKLGLSNSILKPGLISGAGVTYGTFGAASPLPNDSFVFGAGNINGSYFTAPRNCTIYQVKVRVKSVAPGNNGRLFIYDKTAADAGNNLLASASVLAYGTAETVLVFPIVKNILNGVDYWFMFQPQNDTYIYFNSDAVNRYGTPGNYPFGSPPANFSGIFVNSNVLDIVIDYYF